MDHRRSWLIGSASLLAIAAGVAPAHAADQPNTVSEVVVTGIRGSLQKAIQIKKNSDDIVDAISAEDIGKLPDRNVADALQRIPGVNTFSAASGEGGFDENDRVSVRGTPASLTNVTINGHNVSTGDWFILDQFQTVGRSVSFTLLPSEIVNNLVVDKSQNASLLEGGVAGSVDIQTRSPLGTSKPITMEMSVEGAYNSLSGSTKPQISALLGWKNDAGTFGVMAQGFYEERDVRRYGQETLGYSQVQGATGCSDPSGVLNSTNQTCSVGTPTGGDAAGRAIPGLIGKTYPSLIGSSLFEQKRRREGGDIQAQWRPSDQFELRLDAFYSDLDATNHNDNYMFWGSHEYGNNVPTSYNVLPNGTINKAVFPLLTPSGYAANGVAAGTPVDGVIVDNIVRPNAEGKTYYINLDGKFKASDHLTFTGQIGYTEGLGNTPTEPAFESNGATGASYMPSGNGWAVNFPNINPQSANGLANDWAWNETFTSKDKEFYAKVDGDWRVDDGLFKDVVFGIHYANHERKVDGWDRGCSLGPNGQCWTGAMPFSATDPTSYPSGYNGGALGIPGLLVPIAGNPDKIVAILNGITDGVHGPISAIKQAQNYYWLGAFDVKETDIAGYLMARVGGDRWRGNFGVRIVDTQENPNVNVPTSASNPAAILSSAYGPYYVDHVHHDYLDVLPSANLTFDLKPNLLLRFSAAEAMSRPDFSALGGTVALTDTIDKGNGGNPNLKPVKSANFDTSLEWYYGPLSSLSLGLFYMDLQSYVTYGTSTGTYYNQQNKDFELYTISSPSNSTGKVQGFEVQWQQPIAKTGFGFLANYTYADSEDADGHPIVGDSKNTFNVTGYYENKWVSARLAYTYRSHFFVGLDRSSAENQDDTSSLDAAVSVNVTPNVTLTAQGLNLTDELLKYYAVDKTQPRAVYENGRQLYFGLRLKY